MNRRAFLTLSSAGLGASLPVCRPATAAGAVRANRQARSVTTAAGRVRGVSDGGVHIFRGVPYGASTAGANRFQPPRHAGAVDRRARRHRLRAARLTAVPADDSRNRRRAHRQRADERRLPAAERLDAGHAAAAVRSWCGSTAAGSAPARATRSSTTAASWRGGTTWWSSPPPIGSTRSRISGWPGCRGAGGQLRGRAQPRPARSRAGARVGARQHRALRRRPGQRDDLRAVGRRRKDGDAHRVPRREGPLPPRDHHEHAGRHGGHRACAGARRRKPRSCCCGGWHRSTRRAERSRLLDRRRPRRHRRRRWSNGPADLSLRFVPVVDGTTLPAHPFSPASPLSADVPILTGSNECEGIPYGNPDDPYWTVRARRRRRRCATRLQQLLPMSDAEATRLIALYRSHRPGDTAGDLAAVMAGDVSDLRPRPRTIAERPSSRRGARPSICIASTGARRCAAASCAACTAWSCRSCSTTPTASGS